MFSGAGPVDGPVDDAGVRDRLLAALMGGDEQQAGLVGAEAADLAAASSGDQPLSPRRAAQRVLRALDCPSCCAEP